MAPCIPLLFPLCVSQVLCVHLSPFLFAVPPGFSGVALGFHATFACALAFVSNLYCWGVNNNMDLGVASPAFLSSPSSPALLTNVASVAMGYEHACAVLHDSTLMCWGDNSYVRAPLLCLYLH